MNPEVKARAEALAEALADSEEFAALKDARAELEKHEAAKIMMRDFQQQQAALQQKVMAGQPPTEAEVQRLQEAYRLVAFNPYVRKVIEAETAFAELLGEVQSILAEAVGMDVDAADEAPEEQPAEQPQRRLHVVSNPQENDDSPGGRLWVPGR